MKIVVAMDSFKGSLDADAACEQVRRGLLSVLPDLEAVVKPMADGGEGTAQAMIRARRGAWVPREVMGPLPSMRVTAGYAWFEEEREALVEDGWGEVVVAPREDVYDRLVGMTHPEPDYDEPTKAELIELL